MDISVWNETVFYFTLIWFIITFESVVAFRSPSMSHEAVNYWGNFTARVIIGRTVTKGSSVCSKAAVMYLRAWWFYVRRFSVSFCYCFHSAHQFHLRGHTSQAVCDTETLRGKKPLQEVWISLLRLNCAIWTPLSLGFLMSQPQLCVSMHLHVCMFSLSGLPPHQPFMCLIGINCGLFWHCLSVLVFSHRRVSGMGKHKNVGKFSV